MLSEKGSPKPIQPKNGVLMEHIKPAGLCLV